MLSISNVILPVPYYVQVSSVQCQSTVLRMYAQYLDNKNKKSGAGGKQVQEIFDAINTPQGNPDKRPSTLKNAHKNMMWWLESNYTPLKFTKLETRESAQAYNAVINSIDNGFPLIASVSHVRVKGHINIIVGYVRERHVNQSFDAAECKVIVHDPYGAFHPSLRSKLYGSERFSVGMSLAAGGEIGPGHNVVLRLGDVNRQRSSDRPERVGNYEFMYPEKVA
jgi:hypothetical protein